MTYRNLWLGTALMCFMIGASVPAAAQQYFTHFRDTDKPAIEVDLSILGGQPDEKPVQLQRPVAAKTRLAESMYVRSPALENHSAPAEQPAPAPAVPAAPVISAQPNQPSLVITSDAPLPEQDVAVVPATPPAQGKENAKQAEKKKPSLTVTSEPAPEKPKAKKSAQKSQKNKPSLVVSSDAAPEAKVKPPVDAAMKPAPATGPAPIISQPPKPEPASATTEHHDLHGIAVPIISNPPDAQKPPVVQGAAVPAPAPAPVMEAPPKVTSAPAIVSTPEPAVVSAPAPAVETSSPVAEAPAAPVPAAAPAPVGQPELNRPVLAPMPDITVVHEADNPEVSEPALVAQPEPMIAKTPRETPPPLPKTRKPTKAAAPVFAPVPAQEEAARPAPPAEAAQEKAAEVTPEKAAEAAVPAPAPASEEASMPVVPTIADLTLSFTGNSSDLTGDARKKLDAVTKQLKDMTDGRLQVRGFATGEDGSKSSARRIALSRALSVRSYLMDKGVKPTRVDVRAMGSETERSPLDRVDLVFVR